MFVPGPISLSVSFKGYLVWFPMLESKSNLPDGLIVVAVVDCVFAWFIVNYLVRHCFCPFWHSHSSNCFRYSHKCRSVSTSKGRNAQAQESPNSHSLHTYALSQN